MTKAQAKKSLITAVANFRRIEAEHCQVVAGMSDSRFRNAAERQIAARDLAERNRAFNALEDARREALAYLSPKEIAEIAGR